MLQMKILHVITSLRTGGAEKLMVDLLPRFREMGADVDLALFDGADTHFHRDIEAKGIRVFDFAKGKSVYHPAHILRLRKIMKNYDIVHTHNYAPQIFGALAKASSVALCTTEHNTSNRRRDLKWFAPFDRWMYNRYDKVICISEKAEENLREFIGKSKADILTINNGVDISKYASATPSCELEKIAPLSRKIIQVAGFRWEKDQDTVIRALKILPRQFHLFLVGDGARRAEIEALIKELSLEDRVHLLGIRTDVPNLLRAADYVVMSSHFEGLSLSSVEGMAVGKPFLASDVDGLREVVKGAGILFPHQDDKAFAEEILKLDGDEDYRNRISEQCAERAQNYDISTMAENYMKVYQDLMNMKVTEVKATKSLENI